MEGSGIELPVYDLEFDGLLSFSDLKAAAIINSLCYDLLEAQYDPSVLDARSRANQDLPYFAMMTGQGDSSGKKCGEFAMQLACTAKDKYHKFESERRLVKHCKSLTCPICGRFAARRVAQRVSTRHKQLRYRYEYDYGLKVGEDKHWAWSLDPDIFPIEFFLCDGGRTAFAMVAELQHFYAKDRNGQIRSPEGHFGGENILHLWRKKHVDDGRECHLKRCGRIHTWVYGPHFHYTGFGFFDNEALYEDTGGAVIATRMEDEVGYRDIYGTIEYEMSHTALLVSKATGRCCKNYRYVGLLQDRVAKKVASGHYYRTVPCRLDGCEAPLHKFQPALDAAVNVVPDPDLEVDKGEYLAKIPWSEFLLQKAPYGMDPVRRGQVKLEFGKHEPPP